MTPPIDMSRAASRADKVGPCGHDYRLFGLLVSSELPLPGLVETTAAGAPDLRVNLGKLPLPDGQPPGYSASPLGTILMVPKVARFLIRDGREILIEAAPAVSERNLRIFLLGSAFGAVLHQRGLLPLHANAIALDGRVAAFCGRSGAGKSTLAAWFDARGHRLLSDDVCAISFDHGRPVVHPGLPRLRLWRDALERLGRTPDGFEPSYDDADKFDVPGASCGGTEAVPLDRIYLLGGPQHAARAPGVTRLRGVEAVETLVSNTYRGACVASIGRTREHLAACVRLARTVPIFEVKRCWDPEAFDRQARMLERHAAGARCPPHEDRVAGSGPDTAVVRPCPLV